MNEALSRANEPFRFASKATTLERLGPRLTRARTCDQVTLPVDAWHRGREALVAEILERFGSVRLSVRSSAAGEDGWNDSLAGAHLSLIDIEPEPGTVARAANSLRQLGAALGTKKRVGGIRLATPRADSPSTR